MPIAPSPQNDDSVSAEAAIGPLHSLPVFLDLDARRAVVIGGSDGAAWKAELLAMAGAAVDVYCGRPGPRMERLLSSDRLAGSVRRAGGAWTAAALADAAIVVADASDDAEAREMREAARRAGAPINVIDRPAFCDFQFGAIVNRSPIVVGISTGGGAPILGQEIRARTEAALPATLAEWGRLALRIRGKVSERLKPGPQRRLFWEAFARRSFLGGPTETDAARLLADLARLSGVGPVPGRVTVVSAACGDADLLTFRAVRALQAADVILFDDAVSPDLLELARREAARIPLSRHVDGPVGLRDDVGASLTALARAGSHAVLLTNGEVAILDRKDGAISALRANGVAVEIVPAVAVDPDPLAQPAHRVESARPRVADRPPDKVRTPRRMA